MHARASASAVGPNAVPTRGQLVPSVQRAIAILKELASGPPTATLASLSQRLEVPRSSTLALCNTLLETGLLARDDDKAYRLGPGVLELSRAYLDQTDLHAEFQRLCRELQVLPEQTLVLSVLNGTEAVYVGRRPGTIPVGVTYDLGMRLPAHCTASGKALLLMLGEDALLVLYGNRRGEPLPTLTPHSIDALPALLDDLADARRRGYTIDDEETALGMMCVGAPVYDGQGHAVAAVAASMLKAAIGAEGLPHAGDEVRRLAAGMSAALGYREPA